MCAVVAALAGIALERARFGPTDADAVARVERSVRVEIGGVTGALADITATVGSEPALFDAAAADPAGAGVRALLDRADQALRGRTAGVFAVTAYRPSGAWPLAWSGVPSEIRCRADQRARGLLSGARAAWSSSDLHHTRP